MVRDPRDDVKATVAGSGGALLLEDAVVSETIPHFDHALNTAPMVHARDFATHGLA